LALILQEKLQRALDGRMFCGPAEAAKAFEHSRGHVSGRRVDHRVVIGKRNAAKDLAIVIAIKRAPATVAVLHTEKPLDAAANRAFDALLVRKFHALQRHQHERSVVYIGIIIVAEFKRPAARFGILVFYLPVARTEDL